MIEAASSLACRGTEPKESVCALCGVENTGARVCAYVHAYVHVRASARRAPPLVAACPRNRSLPCRSARCGAPGASSAAGERDVGAVLGLHQRLGVAAELLWIGAQLPLELLLGGGWHRDPLGMASAPTSLATRTTPNAPTPSVRRPQPTTRLNFFLPRDSRQGDRTAPKCVPPLGVVLVSGSQDPPYAQRREQSVYFFRLLFLILFLPSSQPSAPSCPSCSSSSVILPLLHLIVLFPVRVASLIT